MTIGKDVSIELTNSATDQNGDMSELKNFKDGTLGRIKRKG